MFARVFCGMLLSIGMVPGDVQARMFVDVSPDVIHAGQPVAIDVSIDMSACLRIVLTSLARHGNQIDVGIALVEPPPDPPVICFATPPPTIDARFDIGSFAAGEYQVTVTGTNGQVALLPGSAGFVVSGAGAARAIPASGLWSLLPLCLAVLGIGMALNLRDAQR